jgi:putative ubiquitin-RnfH superfamily antitoxin RatB of RatAB toxin-antitoxin module
MGIFGKVASPGQVLKVGDRVEIYRPLIADPKEVRKERAARVKKRKAEEKAG